MSTNPPSFESIEIDHENDELIGQDVEGYEVRVPQSDWSDRDQDRGNWLELVEELAIDLEVEIIEEAEEIRLTLDPQVATTKLSENFSEFKTGDQGKLQAKVVIDHLIEEGCLSGDEEHIIFYEDYEEFPEGLLNFAAYVSSVADEIEQTISLMEEELDELQDRREKIDENRPDEKTKYDIDELAEDIREVCGEFRFPKDYSRDGDKYIYDVTAPDDIKNKDDREKFERTWAQILEREEMGGISLSPIIVEELGKKIEKDIDLLERRVVELREAAQNARKGYLDIKGPNPDGMQLEMEEALRQSNLIRQSLTQRQEAIDEEELKQKYAKYQQSTVTEPEPEPEPTEDQEAEHDPIEEEFVLSPGGAEEGI
jgi:hypothetical protein